VPEQKSQEWTSGIRQPGRKGNPEPGCARDEEFASSGDRKPLQTTNHKPQTTNHHSQTHYKPQIATQEPLTRNHKPETTNRKSQTRTRESLTRNHKPPGQKPRDAAQRSPIHLGSWVLRLSRQTKFKGASLSLAQPARGNKAKAAVPTPQTVQVLPRPMAALPDLDVFVDARRRGVCLFNFPPENRTCLALVVASTPREKWRRNRWVSLLLRNDRCPVSLNLHSDAES
jgi:hypothetical protein